MLKAPDGLCISATSRPDSPVLDAFYAGYDRAFVLPDEREELAGFRACLSLNEQWRHAFGRTHCELVVTAADATGTLLAGANFFAIARASTESPMVTVALNYVFTQAAARGRGLLRRMVAEVRALAAHSVDQQPTTPCAMFIEQNDPLRLTAEDYRRDSEHAGVDQVDRLAIWSRLGTRLVDFPYIQPALSAEQECDQGLVYAAVDYVDIAVPVEVFRDHLESFFSISVLKGSDPWVDAIAGAQLAALADRRDPIPLLDMKPVLDRLRNSGPPWPSPDIRTFARQVARAQRR